MPRKKQKSHPKRGPRGEGSVIPDARRGGWIGRVPVGRYPNGRTKYTEVRGDTQAEAVAKKKLVQPPAADITVEEWADRWLAGCGAQPQTLHDYRHTVTRWIKPTLGRFKVRALTAFDVESAVAGWKLGPNTARKNLRQIVTMLEAARRAKLVTENVAKDARGPKSRKTKIHTFAPEELGRIVGAGAANVAEAPFALMATVGNRIGEALALDVSDFDPRAGTVAITKTYDRHHGTRRPKSENGIRVVEVPAPALPALRLAAGTRKTGPLFQHRGRRADHDTTRDAWRALLKRFGLVYRNPHQLRHSVATHSLAAGVPPANVARDLGDSVATIIRTYCHATDGQNVCNAMERLISGAQRGSSVASPPAEPALKPAKQGNRTK